MLKSLPVAIVLGGVFVAVGETQFTYDVRPSTLAAAAYQTGLAQAQSRYYYGYAPLASYRYQPYYGGPVYVRPHVRLNGTYVQPHYRSRPDGNFWNNWSTYRNVNPYTGRQGTKRWPTYSVPQYRVPYRAWGW